MRTHFDNIDQIGLKLALVEKRWLAAIIMTCTPGLDVGLGFFQLHVHSGSLFLAFVR